MASHRSQRPREIATEILELASVAGLAVDSQGLVVASNRLARTLFETDDEELHDQPLSSFCRLRGHPDDLETSALCRSRSGARFLVQVTTLHTPPSDHQLRLLFLREVEGAPVLSQRFEASLLEIARAPEMSAGEFEPAADLLTRVAGTTLGTERTSLWLLDDAQKDLECVSLFDLEADRHERGARLSADQYPAYFDALEQGRAIAAVDAIIDERTCELADYLRSFDIASMLDAVIRVSGEMVGVVCHEKTARRREWVDEEIGFAAEVADQAAHAILATRSRRAQKERDELAEQLRRAQMLDAVGRLAGGVAHDFNNLLTVILGHTEVGLSSPEEGPESFLRIREGAQRAADLTNQLLSVGRKQVLRPRSIDLNELVPDAMNLLRRLIPEHVELEYEPTAEQATVLVDPMQIEQVLINLCINARDAVAEAGGRILVGTSVQTDGDGAGWAVLSVEDDGAGMSTEVLRSAFEPFFTTKSAGEGSGLGLSMVYGIATQHGGDVRASSRPGDGSRFEVLLPLVLEASPGPHGGTPNEANRTELAGQGEHVLLAEDAGPILELSSTALERAGYRVTVAASGQEAVDRHAEGTEEFDLAILDIIMPGLTGPVAYERMRKASGNLPVVFTTGYGADSLAEDLLARKEVELVLKPYSTTQLLEAVRKVLDAAKRLRS